MLALLQPLAQELGIVQPQPYEPDPDLFTGTCAITHNPVLVRVIPRPDAVESPLRELAELRHYALTPVLRTLNLTDQIAVLSLHPAGWPLAEGLNWGATFNQPARLRVLRDVCDALAALRSVSNKMPQVDLKRVRVTVLGQVLLEDPARELSGLAVPPVAAMQQFADFIHELGLTSWLAERGLDAAQPFGVISRYLTRTGACGELEVSDRPTLGSRPAYREQRHRVSLVGC